MCIDVKQGYAGGFAVGLATAMASISFEELAVLSAAPAPAPAAAAAADGACAAAKHADDWKVIVDALYDEK